MKINNHVVRRAEEKDIAAMAAINLACFHGNHGVSEAATQWMKCRFNSFPLYQLFVLEMEGVVVGYIGWEIHGGFQRPLPVVELEQLALAPSHQDRGLGAMFQLRTMEELTEWIKKNNARLETQINFIVWVYSTNLRAIASYEKVFTDGAVGMRTQYGDRSEIMLRHRLPYVIPVPPEER